MTALNAGHERPAGIRRLAALFAVLPLVACSSGSDSMAPSEFIVRFTATNDLLAPVTFLVDGSPYAILSSGASTALSLSSKSHVTWISAKPADSHGQPIPDEIGEVAVSVPAINGVLEITNVINDETYITASIYNKTSIAESIGVYDGTRVACVSQVPAATPTTAGFTQTGYYRLTPRTELRAYPTTDCSGVYTALPQSVLESFQAKSGLVTLEISTVP